MYNSVIIPCKTHNNAWRKNHNLIEPRYIHTGTDEFFYNIFNILHCFWFLAADFTASKCDVIATPPKNTHINKYGQLSI